MKLAIDHYLSTLRERDELDVIVRNLWVARGGEVIKRAFRGEKELGVDVAAIRQEADGLHLYLHVVKSGNLDRSTWDDGTPTSVRSSLNEAIDAPFTSFAKLSEPPTKRHLIVTFNGDVKGDVRSQFEGYVHKERLRNPDLEITYWNLSRLGLEVERSLLGEGLVPQVDVAKLKKALAFADVKDYPFTEYKDLLSSVIFVHTRRDQKTVRRVLAAARLLNRMMVSYAQQGAARKNAVLATEITLLYVAHWFNKNRITGKRAREALDLIKGDYVDDVLNLFEPLKPLVSQQHGLLLNYPGEQVAYPLRVFELLGLGATAVLMSDHLGREDAKELRDLLVALERNNPASCRPLLDAHGIDVTLYCLALAYDLGRRDKHLTAYALSVLENLVLRKQMGLPLPEYHNNLEAVIEYHEYGERPDIMVDSSSTLIWTLLELSLLGHPSDAIEATENVFEGVRLQVWYPPARYLENFFLEELASGVLEASIEHPTDAEKLLDHIRSRVKQVGLDKVDEDVFANGTAILHFIAYRHHRTPVFPRAWRELVLQLQTSPIQNDLESSLKS